MMYVLGSSRYVLNSDVPGVCHLANLADSSHRDVNWFATAQILNAASYAAQGAVVGCVETTSIQFSTKRTQFKLDFGDLGFMLRRCGQITTARCCYSVVPGLREIATQPTYQKLTTLVRSRALENSSTSMFLFFVGRIEILEPV